MNPRGGPNRGQGRKRRENAHKHTISVDDEIWAFLTRNNEPSKEIERLAREEMQRQEETKQQ